MRESIWENFTENGQKLSSDIEVNTLVIGGGICGVLCAYYLKKQGVDAILVEKNKLGNGITKNTTAVCSAAQDILYQDRIKKIGFVNAKKFLDANMFAISEYQKLSEKYDFDFENISTYLFNEKNNLRLFEEKEVLVEMGYDMKYNETLDIPFKAYETLKYSNECQFNPLKLINALSKEIDYYTNVSVNKISDNTAFCNEYKITAKNIIVATHFPSFKFKGLFPLKMHQNKSYVISFKTNKLSNDYYQSIKADGFYMRRYNDQLILGANDIKTGCINSGFNRIKGYIVNNYPDAVITKEWINQDCITLDDLPYIGLIRKGLYVATGFNMWGMTNSILSAYILTNLITNGKSKYSELFNPNRKMLIKPMLNNLCNSVKNLLCFKTPRCPHLGSKLIYNEKEKIYECPCHGSKFHENGKLINGPSKNNLR